MNDLIFEAKENDKMVKFKIIKFFKYKDKNYIIYTEEGNDELFASTYIIKNNELILDEIKTEEEWDYIDKVLEGEVNGS